MSTLLDSGLPSSNNGPDGNDELAVTPHQKNTRAEQSRINGAKSKGPVTPEGKARSSRNGLKHAYCSKAVILANEDEAAFHAYRDGFIQSHAPANFAELDLVETIAVFGWKLKRVQSDINALIDHQMAVQSHSELKGIDIDEDTRSALASAKLLATNNVLDRLERYENQLFRNQRQARNALLELQESRRKHPENLEPEPIEFEEQPIQQKAAQYTPPPANSFPNTGPERECSTCMIAINALIPYPEAQKAVRNAMIEEIERQKKS